MTLFIPIFFLVVNTGQAAEIFPSESTELPRGPGLRRLPAADHAAAGGLVRHGRAVPRRGDRGRLLRQAAGDPDPALLDRARPAASPRARRASSSRRSSCCIALPFGITIASGSVGFLLLVVLTALWGVVYAGFMQLIALKTRSAAATNSGGLIFFPLLFLTPNFVPRDMLTEPMEVAATLNPVTYLMEAMRSLILDDLDWDEDPAGVRGRRRARGADARAQRADDQALRLTDASRRSWRPATPRRAGRARSGCRRDRRAGSAARPGR